MTASPRAAGEGTRGPLAIIGGTGLDRLDGLAILRGEGDETPWGATSSAILVGQVGDGEVGFLARHGDGHTIAPHRINYRANIWALERCGFERIVATAAVGGITPEFAAGVLAVPDQIIDYTWGRGHTFHESDTQDPVHVDFTGPYSAALRDDLLAAARRSGADALAYGTYGATQGPRLESAAEISRMERDGCHIVGMTGMPEAALARELDLQYAHCAFVVNPAAGRGKGPISMEAIARNTRQAMGKVRAIIGCLAAAS